METTGTTGSYDELEPPTVLQAVGDAMAACRSRHGGLPSDISIAGRELLQEPKVAGRGWAHDPIRLSLSLASTYCAASEGLLASTGTVLDELGPGWAVPVVARAALESAGRGFWLVDPTINAQARAARAWTIKMDGWWWRAKDIDDADWFHEVGARTLEILAGAQQRDIRFAPPTRHLPPFVGERIPGSTKAVAALFPPDGSPYRDFSGFAHAGIHSLLTDAQYGEKNHRSQRDAWLGIPIGTQVAFGCAAAFGVMTFADRYFGLHGWRDPEWRATSEHLGRNILALLNEFFPASESS